MFDRLSNQEIADALDELADTIGFKEQAAAECFVALLRKKDNRRCVQEIARCLGLPVVIDLSYASKDFEPQDGADYSLP